MFGDKKMKALDRELATGRLSMKFLGAGSISAKEALGNIASGIAEAAMALEREGRADETIAALRAAQGGVEGPASTLWDQMLEAIIGDLATR